MSAVVYEFRRQARGPLAYSELGIAMGLTHVAVTQDLARVVWALLAVWLGLLLWRLARNPASGFRLREDRIEVFGPGRLRVVPLRRVSSFWHSKDRLSARFGFLSLDDGEIVPVPCGSRTHAIALGRQLSRRGIPAS
jgi:hypothetical protein